MVNNFKHNFCESRIFIDQPEIINSISSIFISILPFFYTFPKNNSLKRVLYLLIFNGFASCYYHYNLSWYGKHLDELSMIYPLYIGTNYIYDLLEPKYKFIYTINDIYIVNIIAINTLPQYDYLFPFLFCFAVLNLLVSVYLLKQKYGNLNVKSLKLSFIGFCFWILSEVFCNRYFYFGHAIWHVLFPLGFIKFIKKLDSLNTGINYEVDTLVNW